MKLPPNNLNYPIRIVVGTFFGSGFLIRHNNDLYLVTAKHVLFIQNERTKEANLISQTIRLICHPLPSIEVETVPRIYEVDLATVQISENIKLHPTDDIVVLKLGSVIDVEGEDSTVNLLEGITTIQESEGALISYPMNCSRRFDNVEITNEIFVLGYPSSLSTEVMRQIDYDFPLVRKGIVAGKNKNNKSIIIDCPVYGGNSGGLVLEMNYTSPGTVEIHLIGVVVQFVPYFDHWQNVRFRELYNTSIENSGYSVVLPVDYIYELIEEIEAA